MNHTPEPPPTSTDTPAVWPLILADLRNGALVEPSHKAFTPALLDACEQRHAFGVAKYGVALQVENGRHPLRDARDEFLDGMAYTRQHFERLRAQSPEAQRGSPEYRRILMAWQLHLSACAVAVLCVRHLENEP
jgi:hypothetical protein